MCTLRRRQLFPSNGRPPYPSGRDISASPGVNERPPNYSSENTKCLPSESSYWRLAANLPLCRRGKPRLRKKADRREGCVENDRVVHKGLGGVSGIENTGRVIRSPRKTAPLFERVKIACLVGRERRARVVTKCRVGSGRPSRSFTKDRTVKSRFQRVTEVTAVSARYRCPRRSGGWNGGRALCP